MNQESLYSPNIPMNGLETKNSIQIFDSHVHIWTQRYCNEFFNSIKKFSVKGLLAMTGPKTKLKLMKYDISKYIIFCYYMNSQAFAKFNIKNLLDQIKEALDHNYNILKLFFGPRFLYFTRNKTPFRIDDERLNPVYSFIEDNNLTVLIHVSDPDIWYQKKYSNQNKYGTKNDRINDFVNIMDKFPNIKIISAHFGCLPENLDKLGDLLQNYPQLFIDTASTRWVIRELGKNTKKTKEWINKFQDRILFGSDLGNIEPNIKFFFNKKRREFYWSTRLWSQRLFWETDYRSLLPFKDHDNPDQTIIYGLNLQPSILEKIYYKNAMKVLKSEL